MDILEQFKQNNMKARVKSMGKISTQEQLYGGKNETLKVSNLDIDINIDSTQNIDWEQRRYELAKAAMSGYMANVASEGISEKDLATLSIREADEMIKQLKK